MGECHAWRSQHTTCENSQSGVPIRQLHPAEKESETQSVNTRVLGRSFISKMENEAAEAIRTGDVTALNQFFSQNPAAVRARTDGQRTLLHVATDWPGHFPNVRQTITALAHRGAL